MNGAAARANRVEDRAPVSLKALAEHLQLSSAAVSRVLNGTPEARSIPRATQERIFQAARELNYRPNLFARSLRTRRSQTIGVVVPEMSEGYATLVLNGIEDRLLEAGYFYFVVSHRHRAGMIERAQALLLERAVEGLIAIDTPLPGPFPVPVVTVSGHGEVTGAGRIELDHRMAAELAIDHLAGLGHRRIAFLKGQSYSSDTEARWTAIEDAGRSRGLTIHPELVEPLRGEDPSHDSGLLATERLLARGGRFSAMFAFNDVSAIGAIRALREAGLRVPDDVSVVGFDDVQLAAFQNPGLTTVRQPLKDMGALAAEMVLERLGRGAGERERPPRAVVVAPELVVRESTTTAPRGSRMDEADGALEAVGAVPASS